MNQEQVNSLVRGLLKIAGIWAIKSGIAPDGASWEIFAGILVGLIGFGWSHVHHATPSDGVAKKDAWNCFGLACLAGGMLVAMGCAHVTPASDTGSSAGASPHQSSFHLDAQTAQDAAVVLKTAARGAAVVAIQKDAKNAEYVKLSVAAIDTFLLGNNYSPGALSSSLAPVLKEANDPTIQLAINTAGDLYQIFYGRYVQGNLDTNAVLFIGALRDGAVSALEISKSVISNQ